jgi:heme ABC exporter ATP-binding subunit CcmA
MTEKLQNPSQPFDERAGWGLPHRDPIGGLKPTLPRLNPSELSGVDVAGVCKSFGSQVVLENVSFRLPGGQGLCICGANAAGKTTLLRIMAGLLQASAGAVQICGFDVKLQARQARARLGAIFHKSMVYPQLTVIENLRFFARVYGVRDNAAHIQKLLEQTVLTAYRYDRAGVLSRGIMQRLAIARALVHKPIVLLADEPFTGLDVDASKHLVTILNNFKNEGGTIVMTTHDVNLSFQCCENAAVLDKRKLIFNAKVCEINADAFAKDYLLYARENHWAAPEML